jgi:uncharacterized Zn finger protein
MTVAPEVGCCRTCGAAVKIIGIDDATLTVECQDCGDVYAVEPESSGGVTAPVPSVARPGEEASDGPDRRSG